MKITSDSVKSARMHLSWSQAELAERSSLPLNTIKRFERSPEQSASSDTLDKLRDTLKDAGVMIEVSFSRGIVVSLNRSAEALRRVVFALTEIADRGTAMDKAVSILREYEAMATAFYEYESDPKVIRSKVRAWFNHTRDVFQAEADYQEIANKKLGKRLESLVSSNHWPSI